MRDFLEEAVLAAEPDLDTRRGHPGGYFLFAVFMSVVICAIFYFYSLSVTRNLEIDKVIGLFVVSVSIAIFLPIFIFGIFAGAIKVLAIMILGGTMSRREAAESIARKLIKAMMETEYLGTAPYRVEAIKQARSDLHHEAPSLGGYLARRLRGLFNEVRADIISERADFFRKWPEIASRLADATPYRLFELLDVDRRKLPESWH